MASFRIKNVEICLSELFLFFLIFIEKITEEKTIICLAAVCFVHEMGHIFALYMMNEKISKIKFTVAGILIVPSNNLKKFGTEIVILLFGPLFNIISGLIIFFLNREFGCFLLISGLFHLMPLQQLDGGRIFLDILKLKSGLEKAERKADFINNIFILSALIFLIAFHIRNAILYLILVLNIRKVEISGKIRQKKTLKDIKTQNNAKKQKKA